MKKLEKLKFNGVNEEEVIFNTYDEFIEEVKTLGYKALYIRDSHLNRTLYEIENKSGNCKLIWVKFLEDEEI